MTSIRRRNKQKQVTGIDKDYKITTRSRRHSCVGNFSNVNCEDIFSKFVQKNKNEENLLKALNLRADASYESKRHATESKITFNNERKIKGKEYFSSANQRRERRSALPDGKVSNFEINAKSIVLNDKLGHCTLLQGNSSSSHSRELLRLNNQLPLEINSSLALPRLTRRRATIHYTSSGSPSVMDYSRRTVYSALCPNEIRALEQFKDVCRDFIVYKLRQHKLINRVTIEREQSKERWLFDKIVFMSKELEKLQKNCFTDIVFQTGITIGSEDVLRKIFFDLSNEIITTEHKPKSNKQKTDTSDETFFQKSSHSNLHSVSSKYKEITWGRLCAILVVAAALAIDCVQHGHSILVNYLIEYVGEFAREEEIPNWIVLQGGWEALRNIACHSRTGSIEEATSANYNRVTNTAFVFVLCTIGAIFAAFAAGNLST